MGAAESLLLDTSSLEGCICKIVVVSPRNGPDFDCLTELRHLPSDARVVAIAPTLELLEKEEYFEEATVLLNVSGTAATLGPIINAMPCLQWIHSITAGLDHIWCSDLSTREDLVLTNAKGVFSSSLAEYVMLACGYFNKNVPRLLQQQEDRVWDRFTVGELRGKTMGIIGYGDIGRACAVLAKAYGMKIVAQRRHPKLSEDDPLIDEVYGKGDIMRVVEQSDFLVLAAPLTAETKGMIGIQELLHAKEGQVLINVGRGPLVDEGALIEILRLRGPIVGAALDVFTVEPLPETSPLWELPNVLLSPHNADRITDFNHRSVKFFTENCQRFLAGGEKELLCQVDKRLGY